LNQECSSVAAQRITVLGQALQLFHFFFMSMAHLDPTYHVRCAIHTNAKTERQRDRVNEDETDFENKRGCCHSVIRDGICRDGDTCGSGGLR
jgi:hypothetical protein